MGQYVRDHKPRTTIHSLVNRLRKPAVMDLVASLFQREEFPDVSFYQGGIDWARMEEKTRKVIIRAGQNLWVDICFKFNYATASLFEISRGIYWFFDGRASPGAQAELLVSLIKNDPPELGIWIDWERNYNGPHEGLRNVVAMMQRIEQLLPGVEVGLYTGYYFFTENSNPIWNAAQYAYLAAKKLWLAFYAALEKVLIPKPWKVMTYWQYGTPSVGKEHGTQTVELDMNQNMAGEVEPIPPPDPQPEEPMPEIIKEGTVSQAKLGTARVLNIRSGPGGSGFYQDIGDLFAGDRVFGVIVSAVWLKFDRIIRANGNIENTSGYASAQFMDVRDVPVEPPTPEEPEPSALPAYFTAHDAQGNELGRYNKQ